MPLKITRNWLIPTISLVITGYFIFHTIDGNYGWRRMQQVKQETIIAQDFFNKTEKTKNLLQDKVSALSLKSLDLDQLAESALGILNMADENSIVIY